VYCPPLSSSALLSSVQHRPFGRTRLDMNRHGSRQKVVHGGRCSLGGCGKLDEGGWLDNSGRLNNSSRLDNSGRDVLFQQEMLVLYAFRKRALVAGRDRNRLT